MPGSSRVKACVLKLETTYGSDAAPTAAANAVLLRNSKITPLDAKMASRELESAAMGHAEDIPVGASMLVEGEMEFAGAGTAGTAPAWGALARVCGMAEVLTATTDARYNPVSSGQESATVYYWYAGKRHKLLGVRGSLSGTLAAGAIPLLKYKLQGIYGGITDEALPAGLNLAAYQKPMGVNKANSPAARLFGVDTGWYEFSFDLANNLVHRNVPGQEDVLITDRAPTGSLTIPDPSLATLNAFQKLQTAELGELQLTHGRSAGHTVGLLSSFVQITKADYEDKDKEVALKLDLKFCHSASGNDDLLIVAR